MGVETVRLYAFLSYTRFEMLSLSLALTLAGTAQDFTSEVNALLPAKGAPIMPQGVAALTPDGPSDVMSFVREGQVLRVTVKKPGENAWTAQVQSAPTTAKINQGDMVFMAFEVRTTSGGRETGEGLLSAFAQRPAPPWDNIGMLSGSFGRSWRRMYFSAKAPQAIAPGELAFTFHIAQQPQVFEFRNFMALNLGPGIDPAKMPFNRITYAGQEPGAAWRKKAEKMIEENRKSDLIIEVLRDGKAAPGVDLDIKLVTHEYPFGTFLDHDPTGSDPDAAKYRELVPQLFNAVTVPIYWADWGWESIETRASYFRRLAWAREQGLPMKAHNLVWPSFKWSPTRLQKIKDEPALLKKTILDEAKERARMLSDQPFVNVDVLNELRTETDFVNIVGRPIYKELFEIAAQTWPSAKLVYNDYDIFEGGGLTESTRAQHKEIVRQLLREKVKVSMLGWQGHFGESLTPPEQVWKLLDEYGEFGLPIEITEFDVDTRDEQSQADYTRDLLTAWFAHPRTFGFTMWGFHEKYHWRPNGAMYRADWTPKPNLAVWKNLTQEVWTSKAQMKTSSEGSAKLRGFRGVYEITVRSGKEARTFRTTLGVKSPPLQIRL